MRRLWTRQRDKVRIFDDAVLRLPAAAVTQFGDDLQSLVDRLLRVQKRTHALGVAASQIGESASVFVINGSEIAPGGAPEVFVNPRIVEEDGVAAEEEGCLSFPGIFISIRRPQSVILAAQNVFGQPIQRKAHGLLARVFSHEVDHLLGRLIIDRVTPETRERIIARMRRRLGPNSGLQ